MLLKTILCCSARLCMNHTSDVIFNFWFFSQPWEWDQSSLFLQSGNSLNTPKPDFISRYLSALVAQPRTVRFSPLGELFKVQ